MEDKAMKITPIASVASDDTDITITARVMNMSTLVGNFGKFPFLECRDHTGEIRIKCDKFGDKMKEVVINGVYTFTHLVARDWRGDRDDYQIPIKADFELVSTEKSEIRKMPYRTYEFKKIEELKKQVSQNGTATDLGMCDVIGMCTEIGAIGQNQFAKPEIELTLVDETTGLESGITLALQRDPATELNQLLQNKLISTPFVAVAKNGRLKKFDGGRINSGTSNMVLIPKLCKLPNPRLTQRQQELEKWYGEAKKDGKTAEEKSNTEKEKENAEETRKNAEEKRENAGEKKENAPKREHDADDTEELGNAQKCIKKGAVSDRCSIRLEITMHQ
ncbi:uncharacterized protein LOC122375523 [Amphibalanus amphitrite]|uniref:uncharacterized protein LOC122375523 n=1 Tax=Amphibalanus amphitrite TaxID=1232801 RepID=UPI001C8FC69B|nr:uncharacterized protein LOC122375523 [Amphibalanus amphitrite]